jgi:aminobenzoyl-glutamate utilization protein B
MLSTAGFPIGAAGHSWGIVAASGTSTGHKGMLHAAKIMALSAMDLLVDPEHLRKAREEFEKSTREHPYKSPLPTSVKPPRYEEPEF